jgi:hypothetical protein
MPGIGVSFAMTFTCQFCGGVQSVIRLNGSPREWTCTNQECGAVYRVSIDVLKPPSKPVRACAPSRYVAVGKC